ncbi:hypothetical protein EV426DRAFT_340460 [Tirmania nivea]|nr:hypothetical protein EV426DRAFT_340460 [Tirmania nivea]
MRRLPAIPLQLFFFCLHVPYPGSFFGRISTESQAIYTRLTGNPPLPIISRTDRYWDLQVISHSLVPNRNYLQAGCRWTSAWSQLPSLCGVQFAGKLSDLFALAIFAPFCSLGFLSHQAISVLASFDTNKKKKPIASRPAQLSSPIPPLDSYSLRCKSWAPLPCKRIKPARELSQSRSPLLGSIPLSLELPIRTLFILGSFSTHRHRHTSSSQPPGRPSAWASIGRN